MNPLNETNKRKVRGPWVGDAETFNLLGTIGEQLHGTQILLNENSVTHGDNRMSFYEIGDVPVLYLGELVGWFVFNDEGWPEFYRAVDEKESVV